MARKLLITLILILIAISVLIVSCDGKNNASDYEPATINLALNSDHSIEYFGIYLAKSQGIFEKYNLTVNIIPSTSTKQLPDDPRQQQNDSTNSIDRLLSNEAHIAIAWMEEAYQINADNPVPDADDPGNLPGYKLRVLSALQTKNSLVCFAKNDSRINSWADFAGKRVGILYESPAGFNKRGNPNPYTRNSTKVRFFYNEIIPAQSRGRLEITPERNGNFDSFANGMGINIAAGLKHVHIPLLQQEKEVQTVIFDPADSGINMIESCFVTTITKLENDKDAIKRFLAAVQEGIAKGIELFNAQKQADIFNAFKEISGKTVDNALLNAQLNAYIKLIPNPTSPKSPHLFVPEQADIQDLWDFLSPYFGTLRPNEKEYLRTATIETALLGEALSLE